MKFGENSLKAKQNHLKEERSGHSQMVMRSWQTPKNRAKSVELKKNTQNFECPS